MLKGYCNIWSKTVFRNLYFIKQINLYKKNEDISLHSLGTPALEITRLLWCSHSKLKSSHFTSNMRVFMVWCRPHKHRVCFRVCARKCCVHIYRLWSQFRCTQWGGVLRRINPTVKYTHLCLLLPGDMFTGDSW